MNDGLKFWEDEVERLDIRVAELETALGDCISTFQNGEGKKSFVSRERVETWECVLKGGGCENA